MCGVAMTSKNGVTKIFIVNSLKIRNQQLLQLLIYIGES